MAGLHRGGVVRIELCDFAFSGPAFIDVSEAALDRAAIGGGKPQRVRCGRSVDGEGYRAAVAFGDHPR